MPCPDDAQNVYRAPARESEILGPTNGVCNQVISARQVALKLMIHLECSQLIARSALLVTPRLDRPHYPSKLNNDKLHRIPLGTPCLTDERILQNIVLFVILRVTFNLQV